jgi:photoactive yellow protein
MPTLNLSPVFQKIDHMAESDLDRLPYGAIQLDIRGNILKYNAGESRLSGLLRENVLGKNFFKQVAPCTDVQQFYGRFQECVAAKKLNEEFRYHFAFKNNPRDVIVSLHYSADTSTVWVLVHPLDKAPINRVT